MAASHTSFNYAVKTAEFYNRKAYYKGRVNEWKQNNKIN